MSHWNPDDYAKNAAFVPALGANALERLNPQTGERILDLGCGDGVLTEKIVGQGAIVVGADASPAMVEAAIGRGIDARLSDAQDLPFREEFDAVFSNAALHWMPDQAAVAKSVFRALKPGGRFVGECGGFGNVACVRTGIRAVLLLEGYNPPERDPQVYMSPAEFAEIYGSTGFSNAEATLVPRPTPLPAGVKGWLKTFRTGFLDGLNVPPEDHERISQKIEDFLAPVLRDREGNWNADYVRLRFSATKP